MPRKCQCRAEICEAIWPRPWRGTALHLQGGGGGTVQELLQNVQSSSLSWSWTLLSLFIVFWGDDSSWKFDHICSYALNISTQLVVYLNDTFVNTSYQSRNIHIRSCCLTSVRMGDLRKLDSDKFESIVGSTWTYHALPEPGTISTFGMLFTNCCAGGNRESSEGWQSGVELPWS